MSSDATKGQGTTMGIRICEGDCGRDQVAVLIDTVHERALPCLFECADDADGFLRWVKANGADVATLSALQATNALQALAESWKLSRCQGCYQLDCACRDCGTTCTVPHAPGCRQ